MKKIATLTAALLFLFVLAGCSQPSNTNVPDVSDEPNPSKASKMDDIPFADDQLYAVACLGYEEMGDLSAYTESYLDSENLPIHYISKGEYYLVIPRYADMTMRLYRNDMETTEGTLIYERGIVMSPNWVVKTICASFACETLPEILSPFDNVIISAFADNDASIDTAIIDMIFDFILVR